MLSHCSQQVNSSVIHRSQKSVGGEKEHCGRFCKKSSEKALDLVWHLHLKLLQLSQLGHASAQGEADQLVTAVSIFECFWI